MAFRAIQVVIVSLLVLTGCTIKTPIDSDDKEKVKDFVKAITRTQYEQTEAIKKIAASLEEINNVNKQSVKEVCDFLERQIG